MNLIHALRFSFIFVLVTLSNQNYLNAGWFENESSGKLLLAGKEHELNFWQKFTGNRWIKNQEKNEQEQPTNATKTLLKNHAVSVVKFGTPWCPACIAMSNIDQTIIKKFAAPKNTKNFMFLNVDGDTPKNKALLKEYKIQGYPTYIIFKKGNIVKTLVGMQNQQKLESEITMLLEK